MAARSDRPSCHAADSADRSPWRRANPSRMACTRKRSDIPCGSAVGSRRAAASRSPTVSAASASRMVRAGSAATVRIDCAATVSPRFNATAAAACRIRAADGPRDDVAPAEIPRTTTSTASPVLISAVSSRVASSPRTTSDRVARLATGARPRSAAPMAVAAARSPTASRATAADNDCDAERSDPVQR